MLEIPAGPQEVLSHRQLRAAGFSVREIDRAARNGEVDRLARGVYGAVLPAETPDQRYLRRIRAAAATTPDLAVGHLSAAALFEAPLMTGDLERVHFVRNRTCGGSLSTNRVVHIAKLEPADLARVGGVLCTAPARTFVDVARTSPPTTALIVGDWLARAALIDKQCVADAFARGARQPGLVGARRVAQLVDGRSESPGESAARWAIHASGQPQPEWQVEIYGPDGHLIGRVDGAFVADAVVVEFDGRIKYEPGTVTDQSASEVVFREKLREDRLRECGLVMVRLTWSDLRDLENLGRRLERARQLGRRSQSAGLVNCEFVTIPARRIV